MNYIGNEIMTFRKIKLIFSINGIAVKIKKIIDKVT